MNKVEEIKLVGDCFSLYEANTTTLAAAETASPVSRYLDAARFDAEMARILRRHPIPVVHVSELPGPNSFRRVATTLGDLASDLAWMELDQLALFTSDQREWRGNWKQFTEGGHGDLPFPHHAPRTTHHAPRTTHHAPRTTLDEDFLMGEGIQAGLNSGANVSLRFGRNEGLLHVFNQWVDAQLESASA